MRLLITRPVDEAQRSVAALRALGHDSVVAPVLRIEALSDVQIDGKPWTALLVTSGNAVRALDQHPDRATLKHLPVFAVGRQTAAAARQSGFDDVTSADGDGGDLVRMVSERLSGGHHRLLYLAGSDRARDLAAEFAGTALGVETRVIYQAIALTEFPPEVNAALTNGSVDGVLHYSRRSTAIFVGCMMSAGLHVRLASLHHYCLSARAAEPLAEMGIGTIRIAARPDEDALLALLKP